MVSIGIALEHKAGQISIIPQYCDISLIVNVIVNKFR